MNAHDDDWVCDWQPDDLNPGPECPYCAGAMCARLDGLGCTHDRIERHGYEVEDVWPHVDQPIAEGDGSAYWAVPE